MRTTISEIARISGVSPATVDRVLNDRAGVRKKTRILVEQTARQLGYFGLPEKEAVANIAMDFVLPAGNNTFIAQLRKHLLEEAANYGGITPTIHLVESLDPEVVAHKLDELIDATDAVSIVAPDHPIVREAINRLAASGVRVATLVSDIPSVNKVGYVGIDNRASGRLAGMLLGRLLSSDYDHEVVVFIGSPSYRGHEEREMGFRSVLAQDFPHLTISKIIQVHDDRDKAYKETREVLTMSRPSGIYNIGSGNQGIYQALRENNAYKTVSFIAHDLSEATKMMLLDRSLDAVIDQNPRVEAREVIKLLASVVRGSKEPEYLPRLHVIFRENIPAN